MTIRVHLFARARELAGTLLVEAPLPANATVAMLRAKLAEQVPALAKLLETSAIAVNHDFAEPELVLAASDEVAIIPPVSGG